MIDDVPLSARALATPDLPEDERPENPEEEPPPGCEQAVASTGACSLACFPELMIVHHVPEGTCAMFECELRDGSSFQIGGCHL